MFQILRNEVKLPFVAWRTLAQFESQDINIRSRWLLMKRVRRVPHRHECFEQMEVPYRTGLQQVELGHVLES